MAKENNIKAIRFLGWYFLRVAVDDLDESKPLKWVKGYVSDIEIPTPPAEGTAILKSVDGVLTWVAEEDNTQQGD